MRRRAFIMLFGGVAFVMPIAARAQPGKTAKIGFLGAASASEFASKVDGFRAGLRDLGYIEGKNIAIEFRWAEGRYDRLPELADELVRLNVDVLVPTLRREHVLPTEPLRRYQSLSLPSVTSGLVTSIARPGGNVTGSSFFSPELAAKRLDVLKDVLPRVKRVGVLVNSNSAFQPALDAMKQSAQTLNIELQQFAVREQGELAAAFQSVAKAQSEAILMNEDPMLLASSQTIADLAMAQHLASFGFLEIAEAGGLIAYGASIVEMHRRAAVFVDKILKGANPGDLPVEQPTKFELIVNLRTAKALSLDLAPTLLARATEVIE